MNFRRAFVAEMHTRVLVFSIVFSILLIANNQEMLETSLHGVGPN